MASILFITQSLSFGGAAKILGFVAESLAMRQHKVYIANLKGTQNVTSYERTLVAEVQIKDFSGMSRRTQIYEIWKYAKSISADIIIGFTGFPNFYARVVGGMLRIPSVMSERGDPTKTMGNTWKSAIVRAVINTSPGGVFQTDGAKTFYGRGLQKRSIVIPNPIFVNGEVPYVAYSDREKTVVSVGRLDNFQKRYDVMLDAFKLFSEKHPEYTLKLYGRGGDEELIHEWVEERELGDRVRFMGLTTQSMQDICRDGMFLITSDFEGISNSLLEAMAVGLPCVSTNHTPGGARLLITPGENGLLAPVGDSVKLAGAMCKFAENPDFAEACGRNAREVLERFSPDRIIDMWESYIIKLCM